MVQKLEFEALIPGCTTREFYQIACADGTAIKQFHLQLNKDDTVTVSDWDSEGRTREITFTLCIAIPASLKRFIGAEPIRILETQTFTWLDSNTLKIENVPLVQVSMADKISTHAQLLLSTTSEGCQIDVTVTVSASVPWPLQSTVESLMADQAKKTVTEYIAFISKYVEDALQEMNNQQKLQQLEPAGAVVLQEASLTQEIEAATLETVQQQQQLVVATPGTPVKPAEAAASAAIRVDARAMQIQQQQQQLMQPVLPAAVGEDVFYDVQEVMGGPEVLNLLLKELQQAQEARREANRLLLSMKDSLQQMERTISKEVAFQEGVRYGQRIGGGTLIMSMAAAAAAASAATAYILMRRSIK